jgi:hypothetical protein
MSNQSLPRRPHCRNGPRLTDGSPGPRGARDDPESLPAPADPIYAAGRELREFADKKRLDRFSLGWVSERLVRDGGATFRQLLAVHRELTTLAPGTEKYERAEALDVWVAWTILWMLDAPHWQTLVALVLYKYMRACGAPLPEEYATACKTRKRMIREFEHFSDPADKRSNGWRRYRRGRYPVSATAVILLHPLPKRRARVSRLA